MSRHSTPTRKSSAPLPIPLAEARGLPVLSAPAQLHADLTELARAVKRKDLPALRRARPVLAGLRMRFAEVDRPADADAIAASALTITTTMPMSGGIEPQLLSSLLCEDLAEMNVTAFELQRAVREVRWAAEFFSLPTLREELRRARRLAGRFRSALAVDLGQVISEAKRKIRFHKRETEKRRERARKQLVALAADFGGTVPAGLLNSYKSILGEDAILEFMGSDLLADDEEAGE